MKKKIPSIEQSMQAKGYSRRDFLYFCGVAAAAAGLSTTSLGQVVKAFETKPRPPVVWLHFQECTCCSESFIRSTHPIVADIIFDTLSLDYTETLMAPAGHQAEKSRDDTIKNNQGKYILLVEGSVPLGNPGFCMIGGKSAEQILKDAAAGAAAVVAWGSCASHGCVQSAKPNPTQATPIHKIIGKPVINVPGCPPIAEVMTAIVTHVLLFGKIPELDSQGRPKEFYSRRVHDTCYRRPYYDAGLFVESWDDDAARKGYCLYKMGCRGPVTYNACAVTKWNGNLSYPIQSGHGCIGCSEAGFWDNGPFYQHLGAFPGFGIESTADKVGTVATVATVGGIALHAITSNIRKQKLIRENMEESVTVHPFKGEGGADVEAAEAAKPEETKGGDE
ncbi:MAG: hydrogenase small subunit [Acidobacteria bacterium]|nr:hydrogenase small subunit [Acidobacteriota bacterium]